MGSPRRILVSKFEFKFPAAHPLTEIPFHLPSLRSPRSLPAMLRLLQVSRTVDTIFISNPQFAELIFVFIASKLSSNPPAVLVFDLIMRAPVTRSERLLTKLKSRLLSAVDLFICIHKDTSAYERHFGISRDKCKYVAFKANNFDLADSFPATEGDYILSLGASHRDYKLLVNAVSGLPVPLKIILPRSSIRQHNADLGSGELPSNVEHVDSPVDRYHWSKSIAESRFVVVPLLPGVIQPAGISVYLEAMVLGKAVIISRGSSTEGILNDDLAVVVPAGDESAMRSAIQALWNDSARRQRLATAARRYALSLGDHSRLLGDLRSLVEEYTMRRTPRSRA